MIDASAQRDYPVVQSIYLCFDHSAGIPARGRDLRLPALSYLVSACGLPHSPWGHRNGEFPLHAQHPQQPQGMRRRDLLKAGLAAGVTLSTWSLHHSTVLWGTETGQPKRGGILRVRSVTSAGGGVAVWAWARGGTRSRVAATTSHVLLVMGSSFVVYEPIGMRCCLPIAP